MQRNAHRDSKLKHTLYQMKSAKKKNPIWKLNTEQLELLSQWGFPTTPHLYRITTRRFYDVSGKCGLLKDIHYSLVKNHKKFIYRKLTINQMAILIEAGVKYAPYKYEIHLQGNNGR